MQRGIFVRKLGLYFLIGAKKHLHKGGVFLGFRTPASQYCVLGQVGFPTGPLRFPARRFPLSPSLRCRHISELDRHLVRTSIPDV